MAPPHLLESQSSPKEASPNLCGSLHVLLPCSALCSRAAVLEQRLDFVQSQPCRAAHVVRNAWQHVYVIITCIPVLAVMFMQTKVLPSQQA